MATASSIMADEEVPPLEDVPDVLEKLKDASQTKKVTATTSKEEEKKKDTKQDAQREKLSTGFGGMKKGFLFGGAAKPTKKKNIKATPHASSTTETKELTEDIPLIKANPAKSSLVLSEVQEAMKETKEAKDFQEGITKRLESNPRVSDVLSDPAWIPILDEFQRDPEAAMKKYKDDAEIRSTMLELCNVLGDTFLHMKSSNTSEEEKLAEKLMEDPRVKEALTDPLVMTMMAHMKNGANDKVQRCFQSANPEQKKHIQTLIDFGLFSFAM
ncbi:uncharacterized protein LOC122247560 [Penaeus japonicus]|uniref:uncharacterized protein LOC122247560 n=1 Tax=Penaeus japonicus TaxID=27405 RepID=UPI001C715859|nr:uncharacterized protein LOC122247560 [Penaeus japonicus]